MKTNLKIKNVVVRKCETVTSSDLLAWINETLDVDLNDLSELSTGVVYCQLLHRLYPRQIPINKINFNGSELHEFESNFKILQRAFVFLGVIEQLPLHSLLSGHCHFYFANWFYKFYEHNKNKKNYNAKHVRKGTSVGPQEKKITHSNTPLKSPVLRCQSLVEVASPDTGITPVVALEPPKAEQNLEAIKSVVLVEPVEPVEPVKPVKPVEPMEPVRLAGSVSNICKKIADLQKKCEQVQQISRQGFSEPIKTMLKINDILYDSTDESNNTPDKWSSIEKTFLKFATDAGEALFKFKQVIKAGEKMSDEKV